MYLFVRTSTLSLKCIRPSGSFHFALPAHPNPFIVRRITYITRMRVVVCMQYKNGKIEVCTTILFLDFTIFNVD
jgi:hypothetical protein